MWGCGVSRPQSRKRSGEEKIARGWWEMQIASDACLSVGHSPSRSVHNVFTYCRCIRLMIFEAAKAHHSVSSYPSTHGYLPWGFPVSNPILDETDACQIIRRSWRVARLPFLDPRLLMRNSWNPPLCGWCTNRS